MSSKSMANFSIGLGGTIRYLAYEILAASSETINFTSASDVWAFGMTVYVSIEQIFLENLLEPL